MSDEELADVKKLLTACNRSHVLMQESQYQKHLKSIKKAINLRVGLPVGILSTLLILILTTLYNVGTSNAEIKSVAETHTLMLGAETVARDLTDQQINAKIQAANDKIDRDFKWLIENGNFKSRGSSPYTK